MTFGGWLHIEGGGGKETWRERLKGGYLHVVGQAEDTDVTVGNSVGQPHDTVVIASAMQVGHGAPVGGGQSLLAIVEVIVGHETGQSARMEVKRGKRLCVHVSEGSWYSLGSGTHLRRT